MPAGQILLPFLVRPLLATSYFFFLAKQSHTLALGYNLRVFTLLSYSRLLHLRTARTLNLNSSTGGATTSGFGSGRPVARLCLLIGNRA